ncbi:MAG: SLATT domain-containing protein [Candidatus Ratteibacteria bacterium]|nr:SLATT domain-containing protein [Candidatus Ratteibacteria bacterium]
MNENKHTIDELNKIRADCMYGKKKHYNARDRYGAYHKRMGIVIIGLTAFMGTSVFYSISESDILTARIIAGILTVSIAVLATLQTFLNFEKRALTHKIIADRYLWLMKKCQRLLSYCKDENKSVKEIIADIENIYEEIKDIQKEEPGVSAKDYQKARAGIKDDEEIYTNKEKEI